MYEFKIKTLELNDGQAFDPPALTVIVGPNNSGKSQLLKDIVRLGISAHNSQRPPIIAKSVEINQPVNGSELFQSYPFIRPRELQVNGTWVLNTLRPTLMEEYHSQMGNPDTFSGKPNWLPEAIRIGLTAYLTTEHRLQLVSQTESAAGEYRTERLLHQFYHSGRKVEQDVSDYIDEVFRDHRIALDFTELRMLRIRVANTFDDCPADPRDAREPMSKKKLLDDQGDGIRSFVGLVVALTSTNRPLILIDEPEAFLHPPQAYEIGRFIARQTHSGRQVIVATHSTDVVRGITSTTQDAQIIRINRTGDVNHIRHLIPKAINDISLDPLLSSSRVLDGLFYPAAVVTEADADNRFFGTAISRLDQRIDIHAVNATSKQTVPKIMSTYCEMGVRRAGIVDFDMLRDAKEWNTAISTLRFPTDDSEEVIGIQKEIAEFVEKTSPAQRLKTLVAHLDEINTSLQSVNRESFTAGRGDKADNQLLDTTYRKLHETAKATRAWSNLKAYGIAALEPPLRARCEQLLSICASHGLFIIPTGELESLLVEYGIPRTTNKREWIATALKQLQSLAVDGAKQPWKIVIDLVDYLSH